ncbi:MAG: hypothetical protein J7J17_02800 [Hadesarchaea archaeon]|nr:hypothetical protein [Hadesarchaea archaeon]
MRTLQAVDQSYSLERTLERIEKKLDLILESVKKKSGAKEKREEVEALDAIALLSLPDHLRKTALAMIKFGKAMAEDVAKETGRSRAIESAYLNQLVRMDYLSKKRVKKRVYFSTTEMNQKKKLQLLRNLGQKFRTRASDEPLPEE